LQAATEAAFGAAFGAAGGAAEEVTFRAAFGTAFEAAAGGGTPRLNETLLIVTLHIIINNLNFKPINFFL
jgi:hypothetical protein